jgi:hypothetical protein
VVRLTVVDPYQPTGKFTWFRQIVADISHEGIASRDLDDRNRNHRRLLCPHGR